MREIVIPYSPRDAFASFHARAQRWACIVAHRRAGKTVACINDLIRRAIEDGKSDGRYAYIAPYYGQARAAAWDYLKKFAGPIASKITEGDPKSVDLLTGARITIYGADNPNALRGLWLDGVVLDEVADMRPEVWGEIIRPALADRQGWAVFIGTPRGHNAFWDVHRQSVASPDWYSAVLRASETGLLPASELADAARGMTADQYAQEFECSFEAAILGAIYAREMAQARDDGRISGVPHEPTLPVDTWWDLGVGDATAIIFTQARRREIRLIDYYEASGEGLPHYAGVLQARGYLYGSHHAPHDIQVREIGSGRSRLDTAASLGIKFRVVPKAGLEDGIHAARMLLPRCWIDAKKCASLIEALQNYRWDYNQRLGELKSMPVHDWSSHAADALRYLAVGLRERGDTTRRPALANGDYDIFG